MTLEEAARRWDEAKKAGRLNTPAPPPDNTPRDCYNRPVSPQFKVTIGRALDPNQDPYRR